jgi:hypothetical protein
MPLYHDVHHRVNKYHSLHLIMSEIEDEDYWSYISDYIDLACFYKGLDKGRDKSGFFYLEYKTSEILLSSFG